jgi:cysteinyl-tRNA synthetase
LFNQADADSVLKVLETMNYVVRAFDFTTEELDVPAEVMALVAARDEAKQQKDFAKADQLRDQVTEMGYQVIDGPQGSEVQTRS